MRQIRIILLGIVFILVGIYALLDAHMFNIRNYTYAEVLLWCGIIISGVGFVYPYINKIKDKYGK